MSSPVNNFLSLIPANHQIAVISPFSSTETEETIVPVLHKNRRSSSTATTDSNTAEEPTLLADSEVVESPTEDGGIDIAGASAVEQPVVVQAIGLHRFLKLGN